MAERKKEGAEPWVMDPWRMDPWTRTMTSGLRFWLSFWPIAPMFGIEWRFAEPTSKTQTKTQAKTQTRENAGAHVAHASGRTERTKSAAPAVTEREAAPKAAAPSTGARAARKDDLTRIKGIGPGVARQLEALGIRSFAQLAALTPKELSEVDAKLTSIRGSCYRNDWVGQAKALAD